MSENNMDRFDEVFRFKLQQFEADTHPDDWAAIEKRLPACPSVPFYRHIRYWAAAAVITLLMVTGSLYLFTDEGGQPAVVQEVRKQTDALQLRMKEEMTPLITADKIQLPVGKQKEKPVLAVVHPVDEAALLQREEAEALPAGQPAIVDPALDTEPVEEIQHADDPADDEPQQLRAVSRAAEHEKPPRKWRFGMGGGGLSMGAGDVMPQYVTQSAVLRAENLQYMNNKMATAEERAPLPKTNVEHKVPISFGLTVSRTLSHRFALQTGLTYSYLFSEWETNGEYHGKTEQGLHLIGIPLSATYLIAQWQRFNVYATGGALTELNVAGRLNTKLYEGDDLKSKISEDIRMKPLLWSLNARVGVSYPLWRFLSAYAEGGAVYYFDNGSDIETIRSEKPFNVNFQFGLRVGF